MPVVPVVHADPAVRDALRRGLRRHHTRLLTCRTPLRLEAALNNSLIDGVVLDVRADGFDLAQNLVDRFPRIPVFACSAFRADDGRLLAACVRSGIRATFVDGVDDAVAGDQIGVRTATRERRALLGDTPERLHLRDVLQRSAWEVILATVDGPPRTRAVAAAVGVTREHLSREFQAGGAPNLKRAIDLARVACAAHLLGNPGYTAAAVAGILRFASPSHLATASRRVTGQGPAALPRMGVRGVMDRFAAGRDRSR